MTGFVVGLVVVAVVVAAVARSPFSRGMLAGLRALGRARPAPPREYERAAAYHRGLDPGERLAALDDRTWDDLDLGDVLAAVDRTVSYPGRQLLYHRLRTPVGDPEALEALERAVRRFADDDVLRATVAAELAPLAPERAGYLCELFLSELPARPAAHRLFPVVSVAAAATLAAALVWPRALVGTVVLTLVNVVVQQYYRKRVESILPALRAVPALVRACRRLGDLAAPELAGEADRLRRGAESLGTLRRAAKWLLFLPGQGNDLAESAHEYANMIFLLDMNAFVLAIDEVRVRRRELRDAFEALAFLDVARSVAEWRAECGARGAPACVPELTGRGKVLVVDGLVHPLLARPVANSLAVRGRSVLITGSNMSGKTTFVRTVGVASVLAQSLHTVPARSYRGPRFVVRTSIGRSDSLLEGKSYYLAEVERVRDLLRGAESGAQHLFLLDEIFRGTNTTERVAAGKAVLAALDEGGNIVLVATHDLELLPLLAGRYAPYHFREQVAEGALTFDYAIRPGPSSTRNAIALLELVGFPTEVVADARETVDRLGPSSERE